MLVDVNVRELSSPHFYRSNKLRFSENYSRGQIVSRESIFIQRNHGS